MHQSAYRLAEQLEVKPLATKPDWAKIDEPPLFTFAWISDFHLSGSNLELTKRVLRYVDTRLKPDFVMITGDNNAYVPKLRNSRGAPPLSLRRQRFLKQFLADNLDTPYVIIPGDNWPQHFEYVFGAFQFSFDYGGMHFLFSSLDRCAYGVEGRAVFDKSTFKWMHDDLTASKDRPTLFMLHETILPPSFLDAVKTRRMLEAHQNVIASFCGHLHVDVDVRSAGIAHLICPSTGRSPRRGFKFAKVHRHAVILHTLEYNEAASRYEKVNKWQKIDIPKQLRAALHKPAGKKFRKLNYRRIPPHPRKSDPTLMKRTLELVAPLAAFFAEFLGRENHRQANAASASPKPDSSKRPATR